MKTLKHYILWFWNGSSLMVETDDIFQYEVEYATSLESVEEITEEEFNGGK